MAKGKKGGGAPQSGQTALPIVQKDLLQRINFSHQASVYLQSLAGPSGLRGNPETTFAKHGGDGNDGRRVGGVQRKPNGKSGDVFGHLARELNKGSKRVSGHNQLRLDPSYKRTICSECSTVLIPGLTSRVRNAASRHHVHITHNTCLHCGHQRSIPSPPVEDLEHGFDGPSRRRRIRKTASRSKITHFDREKGDDASGAETTGHTLWQGQEKIVNWSQHRSVPVTQQDGETIVEG